MLLETNIAVLIHPWRGKFYFKFGIFHKFLCRIDRILEAGLIKHWKQYFWPSDDECALGGGTEMNVVRVYINDMQGAFYVLLLG